MNKIIITGRLTRDPELRHDHKDKPVCAFTLAVDRPFLNSEGVRETDFIPVVVWGKGAELIHQSCRKKHRLLIEGRLQTRNYTTKDGIKAWITEVVASGFEFLEHKDQAGVPYTPANKEPDIKEKALNDLAKTLADSPW